MTLDQHNDTTRVDDQSPGIPDGYTVPADAAPVTCGYCGAPFVDEASLALHRGVEHGDRITAAEREAFESAYSDESEALRLFRLKAIAALVVIYFFLLMAFSVFG